MKLRMEQLDEFMGDLAKALKAGKRKMCDAGVNVGGIDFVDVEVELILTGGTNSLVREVKTDDAERQTTVEQEENYTQNQQEESRGNLGGTGSTTNFTYESDS